MFTSCKDIRRLDRDKGVNKLFKSVLCKGRIQNFFQGVEGHHVSTYFSGRVTWRQIEEQKQAPRGTGMLPRKFLKNLDSVTAILVLFVQFLKKNLFNFFYS